MILHCPYCERRCALSDGKAGACGMYRAQGGSVIECYPDQYSSLFVSHIESIPFYHYQPGSRSLVLGGAGCDFDCSYCSNAYVARSDPRQTLTMSLDPQRIVQLALENGCHNITFPVNEPTVALPTLLRVAAAAKKQGLPVGVLTNGYMQPEVAQEMGRAFSFVNVSLKGWSDEFYDKFVGIEHVDVVLRNIETLHRETFLELSTPILQGINDMDIPNIASFIASIDRHIPWHVFRLLPEYKMAEYDRPNIYMVSSALEQVRKQLSYVYFDNFAGSQWVSTECPTCHQVVVERINLGGCGAKALAYHVNEGHCAYCDSIVPNLGAPVAWNSKDGALCK